MSDATELLDLIPIDQIANQLGVDVPTAQAGVAAALPALLGGMQANAQDEAGAASLVSALASKDSSLLDGGVDVSAIDTADGEKIVTNVFGQNTDGVIAALGAAPGAQTSGLLSKLLPILAPIVLTFLAKKFLGGGQQQAAPAPTQQSGGGLGDVLGSILGGGSSAAPTPAPAQSTGGGIGDILGGLLGGASGGSSSSSGGGLGDLLGGLLGGGKR